ncbi:AAA family ATPase [Pyramidobacter piscolens]|uniref:AAA family ATPase n=1 Tax=Pyramidobacter piscolens TaxID=638849 RepID=UPI00266BFF9A|nr:AAA family ATPase [Pyramidobacter piscolens]
MRFEKLTIENFGPYKDKEVIDFTQDDGVIIVWGDNGRGKTSVLNAFNFLFFSSVKDSSGKTDDFFSFVNDFGKAEGNYEYTITLDVTMDGRHYKISRKLEVIHPGTVPEGNEDMVPVLSVNEGGNIVDKTRAEHIIKMVMPEEVARFFLFDGELLQQYEALLNEQSAEGAGIKRSIEQILGLPILSYGAADAARVYDKYATEANKAAQNDKNTEKYAKQVERLSTGLQEHVSERDRLKAQRDELLKKVARLKKEMEDTEKLRGLYEKKHDIESRIQDKESRLAEERATVMELLKTAWTWMIVEPVREEREALNATIQTFSQKRSDAEMMKRTMGYVRELIETQTCPVCDHHPDEQELDDLRAKLARIEDGTVDLTSDEEAVLHEATTRDKVLREFDIHESNRNEINRRCETINDLMVDIADLRDVQLKDVNDDIIAVSKGSDLEEKTRRVVDDLNSCSREITVVESGIDAENAKIAAANAEIDKLNKKIESLSTNKDVRQANARKDAVAAIQEIFSSAIGVYRDKLKEDVERDATDLFLTMSDEPDYGGLSINDNYGLTIIDKETGTPIPHPSAGWEHMVAFSLIGALHQNAPFEGPIIMDFPFSRMSAVKRRPMMKAVPKMSAQVVLLVFPGEIDPKATRMDIGRSIVSEYTLERVRGKHSHIERRGYDG